MQIRTFILMFMVMFCVNFAAQEVTMDRDCWVTFGKQQYRLFTEGGGVTFTSAIQKCRESNSSLISILSEEENNFIYHMVSKIVSIPVWIGLKRIGFTMYWVDRSSVSFIPTEYTTVSASYSCVYIFDGWIEGHCDNELYFLCKRNISNDDICGQEEESTTVTTVTESSVQTSTIQTTETSESYNDRAQSQTSNSNQPGYLDRHTFEEMIKELRIKKKRNHKTVEAPGSKAIGSIAIFIMIAIMAGIVLLDVSTIQSHLKYFVRNLHDCCAHR